MIIKIFSLYREKTGGEHVSAANTGCISRLFTIISARRPETKTKSSSTLRRTRFHVSSGARYNYSGAPVLVYSSLDKRGKERIRDSDLEEEKRGEKKRSSFRRRMAFFFFFSCFVRLLLHQQWDADTYTYIHIRTKIYVCTYIGRPFTHFYSLSRSA